MFKKILSLGLIAVTMASTVSVFAESTNQPASWALSELNDAEAYGVAPKDFVKVLGETITKEQMDFIEQGLRNKCLEAGLVLEQVTDIGTVATRGEVLEAYYTILQDYTGNLDLKADYISYMKENQILKGYGTEDYRLDEACTVQEALVLASRIVETLFDQLGRGTEGFLWEVSDENNKVYLLGTVHIGRAEVYPLSKGLRTAIEESDKIAFEVDFADQEGVTYLVQKQMYEDNTTLADHIDADTYKRTMAVLEKFGILEDQAKLYKPWALANTLMVLAAQTTENVEEVVAYQPIDSYIYSKALLEEKEIVEIEGYAFQTDLFESIPVEYQIESLKAGLDMIETITEWNEEGNEEEVAEEIELMNRWLQQMKTRDIEGFEGSYEKDAGLESGDLMSKLLFEGRDEHMTEKVVEYLKDETNANYFVAVGAGHMIGESGIVKALQKLGYTVSVVAK